MKIYIEGADLIGKTTITSYLQNMFNVEDRHQAITDLVNINGSLKDNEITKTFNSINKEDFIIILYTNKSEILKERLKKRKKSDEFDLNAELYNNSYRELILHTKEYPNIISICIDNKTLYETIQEISLSVINKKLDDFIETPVLEGESKQFFQINGLEKIAFVKLKSTLYSFTHNRYGSVEKSDELRSKFWKLFSNKLNNSIIEFELDNINFDSKKINCIAYEYVLENKEFKLLSNCIGSIVIKNQEYNIVVFDKKIPNIEIVWKKYLFGTMKHCLLGIEKEPLMDNSNKHIMYEGLLPKDIVRFDWRNPLPNKDECIPEDFAAFYINTVNAKRTARLVSYLLNSILLESDFYLVDLCYFMDYSGLSIKSEITPDGMRIRSRGDNNSYDKDLWRNGQEKKVLIEVWKELLSALEKNTSKTIEGIIQ